MAPPAGRIFTVAIAPRLRPVQNGFDPSTHTPCCFGLCGPDWLEDCRYQCRVDCEHRQCTKNGIDVCGERAAPLFPVHFVSPCRLMACDVPLCAFLKGHR